MAIFKRSRHTGINGSENIDAGPHAHNRSLGNIRAPQRRVILLGASNLTRSFATVVATARHTWGEPVEILAAMGHGRSYGQDSSVFGRKIPGIFPCALWQDLQKRPALPSVALVTDIGNDLLFGVTPDRLLEWVEVCLDRLAEAGAAAVITQMPIGSVESLGEARFRFFRRVFFPRSTLTLADAKKLVHSFNERLMRVGEARKLSVIPVSAAWYGLDPIHLKRSVWLEAWPELFATWRAGDASRALARPSLWTAAYLASLAPWEQRVFGISRRAAQPSGRLADGTTVSLY